MALHVRIPLLVVIVLALAAVLVACDPADVSVQERIGNIDAQPQSEDPTPVPAPTTCITTQGDDDQPKEHCWTPPKPRPTKYPGLPKDLDYAAQDARESGTGSATERVNVTARVKDGVSDESYDEAIKWLDDRKISYRYADRISIRVFIRIDQLPGLVALDAITSVYVPEPAITPREPPNPNP